MVGKREWYAMIETENRMLKSLQHQAREVGSFDKTRINRVILLGRSSSWIPSTSYIMRAVKHEGNPLQHEENPLHNISIEDGFGFLTNSSVNMGSV
jgi:hypothetical protein